MNWSDRVWVELSLVSYLVGFAYSVYSLATNKFLTPRITFWAISYRVLVYDPVPV